MPLADWTVPFSLTSAVYSATPLAFNTPVVFPSGTGTYFLRSDGCSLDNQVRQTKDFVPQADGSILHRRFVAGMEMSLAIQMWEGTDNVACDSLLQEMLDDLMGYLYGLLNAGDNEGRISWVPEGGSSATSTSRMLDDIRLLSYPKESQQSAAYEVTVTIDCALPYSEDLTQLAPSIAGGGGTVINNGNRPTYPVWQVYNGSGANLAFTLTNTTTGDSFSFDDSLPGCANIASGEYVEIDTFRNSVTKVAAGPTLSNVAAGVVMTTSDFFSIPPGSNTITLVATTGSIGGASQALINAAFA
jgi:hypothetical protein